MGAGEQNRRMYAVIKPDDNNEMQNINKAREERK